MRQVTIALLLLTSIASCCPECIRFGKAIPYLPCSAYFPTCGYEAKRPSCKVLRYEGDRAGKTRKEYSLDVSALKGIVAQDELENHYEFSPLVSDSFKVKGHGADAIWYYDSWASQGQKHTGSRFINTSGLVAVEGCKIVSYEIRQRYPENEENLDPSERVRDVGIDNAFVLRALGEPDLNRQQVSADTTIRFLWLRSFDFPVSVRLVRSDGKFTVITASADITMEMGAEREKFTTIRDAVPIDPAAWRQIVESANEAGFWEMSSIDKLVIDGAAWIIEARLPDRYHVVYIHSPKADRPVEATFRKLALSILDMGTIRVPPYKIY